MDIWEFYVDSAGEWRWRLVAPNGEIIGASTEGYKNEADCKANAARLGRHNEDFVVVEEITEANGGIEVYMYSYNDAPVGRNSLVRLSDDELKEPLWWLGLIGKLARVKIYRAKPA